MRLLLNNLSLETPSLPEMQSFSASFCAGEVWLIRSTSTVQGSLLLQTLAGHSAAAGGHIEFDGFRIDQWPVFERSRLGITYLPSKIQLFYQHTVAAHLWLACGPGISKIKKETLVKAFYMRYPLLAERSQVQAGALSGGEQQLLALACVLIKPVKLLLLDEPTQGLAPQLIIHLAQHLNELCLTGTTLLLIEKKKQLANLLDAQILDLNSLE